MHIRNNHTANEFCIAISFHYSINRITKFRQQMKLSLCVPWNNRVCLTDVCIK